MKAKISTLILILFVSIQYICGEEASTGCNTSAKVNIPRLKVGMEEGMAYNHFVNLKRISLSERGLFKIDDIDQLKDYSNGNIARGKTIYQNDAGRLENIYLLIEDHSTTEYLISYDCKGKYIAHLKVGGRMYYAGDNMSAVIEGNEIHKTVTWADTDEEGIIYTDYIITPDLKFKQVDRREETKKY